MLSNSGVPALRSGVTCTVRNLDLEATLEQLRNLPLTSPFHCTQALTSATPPSIYVGRGQTGYPTKTLGLDHQATNQENHK